MSERRVNGTGGLEVGSEAPSGPRWNNGLSAAASRTAEREADRALENLRQRDSAKTRMLDAKLHTLPRVLVGEREQRLYPLAPEEVDYIESRGNYVEFHAAGLVFISRDSIKRLWRVLSDRGYIRIQRTLLLNIRCIRYAQPAGRGRYAFTLSSGVRLSSGARYREEILRMLPLTRARRLGGS
jgi:DNA-binding LytR/AlgR family response regulator